MTHDGCYVKLKERLHMLRSQVLCVCVLGRCCCVQACPWCVVCCAHCRAHAQVHHTVMITALLATALKLH
jgi:hypothetical protein